MINSALTLTKQLSKNIYKIIKTYLLNVLKMTFIL